MCASYRVLHHDLIDDQSFCAYHTDCMICSHSAQKFAHSLYHVDVLSEVLYASKKVSVYCDTDFCCSSYNFFHGCYYFYIYVELTPVTCLHMLPWSARNSQVPSLLLVTKIA